MEKVAPGSQKHTIPSVNTLARPRKCRVESGPRRCNTPQLTKHDALEFAGNIDDKDLRSRVKGFLVITSLTPKDANALAEVLKDKAFLKAVFNVSDPKEP
jgi:hypothetical protein